MPKDRIARRKIEELTKRVEKLEWPVVVTPPPDPEPTDNWEVERVITSLEQWNSRLIEGFNGASITKTSDNLTSYYLPGPQHVSGGRVETQLYFGQEGETCAYDYPLIVPASTKLSTHYSSDPKNIITQHHGNNDAGYTGGVYIYPDGRIALRIRGGKENSMSGSHDYDYDELFVFGEYDRDTEHRVRLEIKWDRADGFARAQLDGGRWEELSGVPTWPVGEADGNPSDIIMYRHGWYPQGGYVEGNMTILFGDLSLEKLA